MTTPIDRVLAHVPDAKRSGKGWTTRCPAHDDRNASLSIGVGDDGRALVHCHAGCDTAAIVGTWGMTMADLMPDAAVAPRHRHQNPVKPVRDRGTGDKPADPRRTFPTAEAAVGAIGRTLGATAKRTGLWWYRDCAGEPVGCVARWQLLDDKVVRPFAKSGDTWIIGAIPEPRPVLNLPELLARPGERIFVVEGEKCCDAMMTLGLLATTSAGGAKAATKTDWRPLAGRDVVALPDHDESGESYVEDVAAALATLTPPANLRVLRVADGWPDCPKGGDVADLIELRRAAGVADDVIRAELVALADTSPSPRHRNPPSVAPDSFGDGDALPDPAPRLDLPAVFPESAEAVSDYFKALAESTQTPVEMVALLGLAVASAGVCGVAEVRGHGDHVEPAPLWSLVLSDPGTRKSAVLAALQAPVLAWESELAEAMRPVVAEADQKRKIAMKRLGKLEDDAARGKDRSEVSRLTADAVALRREVEAEPVPVLPKLLACEPTPEALAQQMAANHGRALLASAEADALDIIQGRYSGGANFGLWLKAHAGDAVRITRVGRPADTIDRPTLALALCVQPEAVRSLWADRHAEGRGLLARFMLSAPPDLVGRRNPRPAPVPASLRAGWDAAVRRLLSFEPKGEPVIVGLSPEADVIYYTFQQRIERELGGGILADRRAWGGKLVGLALRIALTLHAMATWGAMSGRPEDHPTIDAATMTAAIAWADYLMAAERHAVGMLAEDEAAQARRRLIDFIQRKGGSVTARDLAHGLRDFRSDTPAAEAALGELVEAGLGAWEPVAGAPGRPTRRFLLRAVSEQTPVTETPGVHEDSRVSVTVTAGGADPDGGDWGVI